MLSAPIYAAGHESAGTRTSGLRVPVFFVSVRALVFGILYVLFTFTYISWKALSGMFFL